MANRAAARMVCEPFSEEATIRAAREALHEIGGKASCAFVFASADYREALPDFLELVQLHAHAPMLAGCSGSGLISTSREEESATGFSLLLLHLPETELQVVSFSAEQAEEVRGGEAWRELAGVAQPPDGWIVLGNPASLPIEEWMEDWNAAFPGTPALGGLASGGSQLEDIYVFHDRHLVEGGVAIGLRGGVHIETIVSQGCRPIGEPFTVTGAEANIVTTLGSRPAYEILTETLDALPANMRSRIAGNIFAGLAMSEYVDEYKTGDFLVRNVIGADPNCGAVAIGAVPRVGQTLQFQLRDRLSANEDLQRMLLEKARTGVRPFANLLFSCGGRGQGLFGVQNHDAMALSEHLGPAPTAGFFCNGEIGPVGGRNYVHGYTASMALLCDPIQGRK